MKEDERCTYFVSRYRQEFSPEISVPHDSYILGGTVLPAATKSELTEYVASIIDPGGEEVLIFKLVGKGKVAAN